MCFYYHMSSLAQRHSAKSTGPLKSISELVNGFRHPSQPVVRSGNLEMMNWGLIPSYSREFDLNASHLNARQETAFDKPSFRNAIQQHRCLIPANGFFEWQHIGNSKQPWYIRLRDSEDFCFAGIWEQWKNPTTNELYEGFAIMTTPANPLMARIHNTKQRMPVILTLEMESVWLDANVGKEDLREMMVPISEKLMEAWTLKPFDIQKPPSNLIDRQGGQLSLF